MILYVVKGSLIKICWSEWLSFFAASFRLCQDVVLAKAEVAELLLPSLVVNLAGRKDMDVDLLKLISLQVESGMYFGLFLILV